MFDYRNRLLVMPTAGLVALHEGTDYERDIREGTHVSPHKVTDRTGPISRQERRQLERLARKGRK